MEKTEKTAFWCFLMFFDGFCLKKHGFDSKNMVFLDFSPCRPSENMKNTSEKSENYLEMMKIHQFYHFEEEKNWFFFRWKSIFQILPKIRVFSSKMTSESMIWGGFSGFCRRFRPITATKNVFWERFSLRTHLFLPQDHFPQFSDVPSSDFRFFRTRKLKKSIFEVFSDYFRVFSSI